MLTELRGLLGMTQEDVAKRAGNGTLRAYVAQIENGSCALRFKERIEDAARGYGLSVVDFERLCAGEIKPATAARRSSVVRILHTQQGGA